MPVPDRDGSFLSLSRHGFHRVAYVEWGDPGSQQVAVCLHGLSRQGRDFDRLAASLAAKGWRVVCPDLVGRGRSDHLQHNEDYALPQYAVDMAALIARLGVDQVDWIGTSLGGLTGMILAGQDRTPIRRLVVNDIGPYLPWQALHRIGTNLRQLPLVFPDFAAASEYYRTTLAPFGPLTDAEWDHLARYSIRQDAAGRWHTLCDPGIAEAFRSSLFYNVSLWTYWDAIRCPSLVLRGIHSDLLLASTVAEMGRRGPCAEIRIIPDCGHAPALLDPNQIETITDWLANTPP